MESDEIKDIAQETAKLSIEDDENDALKSTETTFEVGFEEYSEDNNDGIMELKVCVIFFLHFE